MSEHGHASDSAALADIGFVVIGRNEGARLVACLASLGPFMSRTVYVDSSSTDDSVAAATGAGATVVNLDMTTAFTAARARNAGFASLKAVQPGLRYVQFIDGDCILVDGWIADAFAFLEQHADVAVVCGRRRERFPRASIFNQMCDYEWDTPVGEAAACGGDSLVRVAAFEAVGGFNPDLAAGEEPELCLRLRDGGWKIWRLDSEMTLHDIAMTRFAQWWTRTVRGGYGAAEVSRLHRRSSSRIYRKETLRAVLWGGVLPVVIVAAAMIHPLGLALALVYPLQVLRLAVRDSPARPWNHAVFTVLAKFAEFHGVVAFYQRLWLGRMTRNFDYKRVD